MKSCLVLNEPAPAPCNCQSPIPHSEVKPYKVIADLPTSWRSLSLPEQYNSVDFTPANTRSYATCRAR